MSTAFDVLLMFQEDVLPCLAAGVHLSGTTFDFQVEQYKYRRTSPGIYITNLRGTWEKASSAPVSHRSAWHRRSSVPRGHGGATREPALGPLRWMLVGEVLRLRGALSWSPLEVAPGLPCGDPEEVGRESRSPPRRPGPRKISGRPHRLLLLHPRSQAVWSPRVGRVPPRGWAPSGLCSSGRSGCRTGRSHLQGVWTVPPPTEAENGNKVDGK